MRSQISCIAESRPIVILSSIDLIEELVTMISPLESVKKIKCHSLGISLGGDEFLKRYNKFKDKIDSVGKLEFIGSQM